jgi:GGDEF domain-containing protein
MAELQKTTAACYLLGIRAAADYAIEFDPSHAAEFRKHLSALQHTLEHASGPEEFHTVQSSFRGELREYRDRARDWMETTRGDLTAAAEAMEVLAHGVASDGSDHAKALKADLEKLLAIADTNDPARTRAMIRSTAARIAQSSEGIRRETQLVVAQLHDEIRSLHREIDHERKALYTDPASGAWNRDKLTLRMTDLLNRGEGFCAVVLWIGNLKRLESTCSPSVMEGALRAMVKRLNGIIGSDAVAGRWAADEFLVLLDLEPATAVKLSSEIGPELSTRYSVQENGIAQHLTLRIVTAVADHTPGSNPDKFREKLQLLTGAMQASEPRP